MSSDYFNRYLAEIGGEPLLSLPEELDLGKTLRCSRNRNDIEKARLTLFSANLRLVVGIAGRYAYRPDFDLEEFTFVGNTGLFKAVNRYDPSFGVRFSTYATWWIRNAIQQGTSGLIRVPKRRMALIAKRISAKDPHDSGVVLTRRTELPVKAVHRRPPAHVFSLDEPIPGTEELVARLESSSPEPSVRIDCEIALAAVENELLGLEQVVLKRRYGIGCEVATLEALGRVYGLTGEAIRRTELRALARLRSSLGIEVNGIRSRQR